MSQHWGTGLLTFVPVSQSESFLFLCTPLFSVKLKCLCVVKLIQFGCIRTSDAYSYCFGWFMITFLYKILIRRAEKELQHFLARLVSVLACKV